MADIQHIAILKQIKAFPRGTKIPKPISNRPYRIRGWGKSRGEDALVYEIPPKLAKRKPSTKRITESDFNSALSQLSATGKLTRKWFNENLPDCAKDGGCNFTTIGGIFELLGLARYTRPATYISVR
jgi:hypothetical protein